MAMTTPGKCCACLQEAEDGEEESPCPARRDGIHCECWWDGPDKKEE